MSKFRVELQPVPDETSGQTIFMVGFSFHRTSLSITLLEHSLGGYASNRMQNKTNLYLSEEIVKWGFWHKLPLLQRANANDEN